MVDRTTHRFVEVASPTQGVDVHTSKGDTDKLENQDRHFVTKNVVVLCDGHGDHTGTLFAQKFAENTGVLLAALQVGDKDYLETLVLDCFPEVFEGNLLNQYTELGLQSTDFTALVESIDIDQILSFIEMYAPLKPREFSRSLAGEIYSITHNATQVDFPSLQEQLNRYHQLVSTVSFIGRLASLKAERDVTTELHVGDKDSSRLQTRRGSTLAAVVNLGGVWVAINAGDTEIYSVSNKSGKPQQVKHSTTHNFQSQGVRIDILLSEHIIPTLAKGNPPTQKQIEKAIRLVPNSNSDRTPIDAYYDINLTHSFGDLGKLERRPPWVTLVRDNDLQCFILCTDGAMKTLSILGQMLFNQDNPSTQRVSQIVLESMYNPLQHDRFKDDATIIVVDAAK